MTIKQLSNERLATILLTTDGKGRDAKIAALNELLDREFDKGYFSRVEQSGSSSGS